MKWLNHFGGITLTKAFWKIYIGELSILTQTNTLLHIFSPTDVLSLNHHIKSVMHPGNFLMELGGIFVIVHREIVKEPCREYTLLTNCLGYMKEE